MGGGEGGWRCWWMEMVVVVALRGFSRVAAGLLEVWLEGVSHSLTTITLTLAQLYFHN